MIQTIPAAVTIYTSRFPAQGNSPQARQAQLRDLRNRIEAAWLELGAVLRAAHDAQDWRTLNYISFASYVEDTLRTSKSEAYDLMRLSGIAQRYPELTPRILDAGKSNMRAVLSEIKNEEDAEQVERWIDCAAVNTWRELRAAIDEQPPAEPKRRTVACPHCGAFFEI